MTGSLDLAAIEWVSEPPRSKFGYNGKMMQFVEELRKHPEQWAKYPTPYSSPIAAKALRDRFPGTQWTTRHIRANGSKRSHYVLYGRAVLPN